MSDRCRLPDFWIIGAQKSATTYLVALLGHHPEAWIPRQEIPFFEDPVYGDGDPRRLAAFFAKAPEGVALGGKRPNCIGLPEVPGRMAYMLPKARLVAILRNPVERALSAYYHLMRNGRIPVEDPDAGFERILSGRSTNRMDRRLLEFGLYGRFLDEYANLYDPSQLRVVLQEDFAAKPDEVFAEICDFLGIARLEKLPVRGGVNRNVYDLDLVRWQSRLMKIRKGSDDTYVYLPSRTGMIGGAIDWSLLTAGRSITAFYKFSGRKDKPSLSRELKLRLLDYYLDDIEKTERLFGFDLSDWKRVRG
jgi:hypothetical protein